VGLLADAGRRGRRRRSAQSVRAQRGGPTAGPGAGGSEPKAGHHVGHACAHGPQTLRKCRSISGSTHVTKPDRPRPGVMMCTQSWSSCWPSLCPQTPDLHMDHQGSVRMRTKPCDVLCLCVFVGYRSCRKLIPPSVAREQTNPAFQHMASQMPKP
jgi:hypothetical protein